MLPGLEAAWDPRASPGHRPWGLEHRNGARGGGEAGRALTDREDGSWSGGVSGWSLGLLEAAGGGPSGGLGGPHQGPPARGRRPIATAVWPGERRSQDTVYSRAHRREVSGRRCGTHAILKLKVIP